MAIRFDTHPPQPFTPADEPPTLDRPVLGTDEDGETIVMPDFRLVIQDETKFWDVTPTDRSPVPPVKMFAVYLTDVNLDVHICSTQPSAEAFFLTNIFGWPDGLVPTEHYHPGTPYTETERAERGAVAFEDDRRYTGEDVDYFDVSFRNGRSVRFLDCELHDGLPLEPHYGYDDYDSLRDAVIESAREAFATGGLDADADADGTFRLYGGKIHTFAPDGTATVTAR